MNLLKQMWDDKVIKQMWDDFVTLRPVGFSFLFILVSAGLSYHLFPNNPKIQPIEVGLIIGVIIGPLIAPMTARRTKKVKKKVKSDVSSLYLEGKMKRYSLLFSVNGGAFAIVQFSDKMETLGNLGKFGLPLGLVIFTILMTADIWLWGADMRKKYGRILFRPLGQTILLMIGALLVAGWLLIGVTPPTNACSGPS